MSEMLMYSIWLKGDDGSTDEPQQGVLVKESESLYSLWCTGRVGCDGMLVEIKVCIKAFFLKGSLCGLFLPF